MKNEVIVLCLPFNNLIPRYALCCELSMDQVRWFFRQTNLANNTSQLSFFLPLESSSIDKASAYHSGSVEENEKIPCYSLEIVDFH